MGLDSVELVMALEEAFGVSIANEEAEALTTPRAVIDLLFTKLQQTDARTCQTQRAFYLLRRGVMTQFGRPRDQVTLDLPIRSLMSPRAERLAWPALGRAVSARTWPALDRPAWMVRALHHAGLLLFLLALAAAWRRGLGVMAALLSGGLAFLLFEGVAFGLTRRFVAYIPASYRTLRDLVPAVLSSDHIAWTREQVAARVKQVVLEQLGLKESEYREDAEFVRDFGVD